MTWRKTIENQFPDAIPCHKFFAKANWKLAERGLTPANTLFAECTCRDEINQPTVEILGNRWGESFNLSGLAGFPVAGKTGFSAYANHAPDNGNLFIFYGPHVGIDREGNIGQIRRDGMTQTSTCCGSLLIYLDKLRNDVGYKPKFDPLDVGQYLVESSLDNVSSQFLNDDDQIVALTNAAFLKIEQQLLDVITQSDCSVDIYLLGGLIINTPRNLSDHFVLKSALNKKGSETMFTADWITL